MKLHVLTRKWWEKVLDEDRVDAWLLRLHQAELQGSERFQHLIDSWKPEGEALEILKRITDDEEKHGMLVELVLMHRCRMRPKRSWPEAPERYWDNVYQGVDDLQTACAAAAFGEMLALNRFRVLIAHERTPGDIRLLAEIILPDEERHARDLRKLAGSDGMNRVRPFHKLGMEALGLIDIQDDETV